jgi:hypothetical protein
MRSGRGTSTCASLTCENLSFCEIFQSVRSVRWSFERGDAYTDCQNDGYALGVWDLLLMRLRLCAAHPGIGIDSDTCIVS